MADVEGAKAKAHKDAENIVGPAEKKADEALAGSTYEQHLKGDGEKEAPTSLGDKASQATEKGKESTGSAWESTKQGAAAAAEKTKDVTGRAWESAKQDTSETAERAKEKGAEAKDQSAGFLQMAGEKVKEATSATYGALDKANRYETYQSKE